MKSWVVEVRCAIEEQEAVVEVPKWTFLKWRSDGKLDYVSPLPSPFNYGCLPATQSGDGDPVDAIVLGPRLARGTRVRLPVCGRVRFIDAGLDDPKLVLSASRMTRTQRTQVVAFFRFYTGFKRLLNRSRRRRGLTQFEALEIYSTG